MPANTAPIFTLTPKTGFGTLVGAIASARSDGVGTIGTDMFVCHTAGANGGYVSKVRISAAATTPTTMTASVIRLFISNKTSGGTTAADTVLWAEISTAAITAANAVNAINYYDVPCDFALPAGYTILASIHADLAANTRWQLLTIAGDY
jgi:hypothetical protein